MKFIILLLATVFVMGCSVKEATAPTAPPTTENKQFNVAELSGVFCQSDTPKMFLWPTERDGKALSYDEQALSRQIINKYNDEVTLYSQERDDMQAIVDQKYLPSIETKEKAFTSMKCYSYCDPDDFLCDPTDATITEVDTWKVGETPEEEAQILLCQENQTQRKEQKDLYKDEISKKVTPLNEKAGEAALALLREVGDANYFTGFTKFQYRYDGNKLVIELTLNEQVFSTQATENKFKINNANFDKLNGYLSFSINAIDVEDDKIYGEFRFDLEFIFSTRGLRLDGDFVLENFKEKTEKVGRISASGAVKKSCE